MTKKGRKHNESKAVIYIEFVRAVDGLPGEHMLGHTAPNQDPSIPHNTGQGRNEEMWLYLSPLPISDEFASAIQFCYKGLEESTSKLESNLTGISC